MLLGVYWYYGFPKGLYHFDFFTFRPGLGGHADGPAELTTTAVAACLAAHGGQPGHLGKYPVAHPQRGPHVVRMVDANFIR